MAIQNDVIASYDARPNPFQTVHEERVFVSIVASKILIIAPCGKISLAVYDEAHNSASNDAMISPAIKQISCPGIAEVQLQHGTQGFRCDDVVNVRTDHPVGGGSVEPQVSSPGLIPWNILMDPIDPQLAHPKAFIDGRRRTIVNKNICRSTGWMCFPRMAMDVQHAMLIIEGMEYGNQKSTFPCLPIRLILLTTTRQSNDKCPVWEL